MLTLVRTPPAETLGSVERVQYGKQRATAAITLLRKGWNRAELLEVLEVTTIPEAMTQFVHRCKARGRDRCRVAGAVGLAGGSEAACSVTHCRWRTGSRWTPNCSVLLLALGEYSWGQIPEARRAGLRDQVADLFRDDKSSGVHAAAGWLLRQWGAEDAVVRGPGQATG